MNEEAPRMDDAGMRLALRGLRRDIEPAHDLWPGIASRLHPLPQKSGPAPRRSRPAWLWPIAMAASLVLAVGLAWQPKPDQAAIATRPVVAASAVPGRSDSLVQREAEAMTTHYEAALREISAQAVPAGWQPGFEALDRSAIEIRGALQHDPDSRLLLQRLRHTYTRRLALARRALYA